MCRRFDCHRINRRGGFHHFHKHQHKLFNYFCPDLRSRSILCGNGEHRNVIFSERDHLNDNIDGIFHGRRCGVHVELPRELGGVVATEFSTNTFIYGDDADQSDVQWQTLRHMNGCAGETSGDLAISGSERVADSIQAVELRPLPNAAAR